MNCITRVKKIVDLLLWPHHVKEEKTLGPAADQLSEISRVLPLCTYNGLGQIFNEVSCLSGNNPLWLSFPSFHPGLCDPNI